MLGRGMVGQLHESDGLTVVLALRVLAEPNAADDIRGRDTGVDAHRREGIGDIRVFFGKVAHEACRGEELLRLAEPSLPNGSGARLGPHVRRCACEAAASAIHGFRPR